MHYLILEDSSLHKNLGAHWKCLIEMLPMSTHKKQFHLELFLSAIWKVSKYGTQLSKLHVALFLLGCHVLVLSLLKIP